MYRNDHLFLGRSLMKLRINSEPEVRYWQIGLWMVDSHPGNHWKAVWVLELCIHIRNAATSLKLFKTPYSRFTRSTRIFLLSSLPDVLCDPIDLIWREGTPFEAMTGRTAFIDGKVNARRFVYRPRYHLIITLLLADWRGIRGKWPLPRNSDRSLKLFWLQSMTLRTTTV